MNLKSDFPIFQNNPGLVYLDSAATTQKPSQVIDGIKVYLENDYANIHRGRYELSARSEELYREARKKTAELIGAEDDEIVFTSNSTDANNRLVQSLLASGRIVEGDTVLLGLADHHANTLPRQIAAKRYGIKLDFIALDDQLQLDLDDLRSKLDETVKIVALTWVSNVTGGMVDVRRVREILREKPLRPTGTSPGRGGNPSEMNYPLLILDASQAVPHVSVDVKEIESDFLYFTGHKMMASTGIGVLWGKKELLRALTPGIGGGGAVESVTTEGFTLLDTPDKFEPGTPNLVGAVSLLRAIEYFEQIGGYEKLASIECPLMEYTLEQFQLLEAQGVRLLGSPTMEDRVAVFSFTLPTGKHPTQLGQVMAGQHVCIRCGGHCAQPLHDQLGLSDGTCRISLYLYNQIDDIIKFFDIIKVWLAT